MRRQGSRHNVASEHKWPAWVTPPVMCAGCGGRVTLKQSFQQDTLHGTYHATPECLPYQISVVVDRKATA